LPLTHSRTSIGAETGACSLLRLRALFRAPFTLPARCLSLLPLLAALLKLRALILRQVLASRRPLPLLPLLTALLEL
jgi:hypothetical protein